jgi:hypothetical protein
MSCKCLQSMDKRQIEIDVRISENIYELARGHGGLTCFCGKQLDEVLMRGRDNVTFEDWIKFTFTNLVPNL